MKEDYHIREPQYGAGTTHHWDQEKYGINGIGLATFRIRDKMILKIRYDYYELDKQKVMEFMNKYPNSQEKIKGVQLYVFPIAIMKFLKEGKRPVNKKLIIPKKDKPPTLF